MNNFISRLTRYKVAILYILCGFLLFSYVTYKAFFCEFTHDESFSFYLVKTMNIRAMAGTANTHWLNSFGIWLFSTLFQSDTLGILRLQSIIAFVIYAVTVFLFSKKMSFLSVQLLFIVITVFNPYVLDYFALARGYGLSVAFQLSGLYYFYLGVANREEKTFTKSWLLLALSVFSNYSAFYIFFIAAFYYMVRSFLSYSSLRAANERKLFIVNAVLIAGTIFISIVNLLIIRHFGDLEYGAKNSFIDESLNSLIYNSFYGRIGTLSSLIIARVLFVILSVSSLLCFYFLREKLFKTWLGFLSFLFIGVFLLSEVLQLLFKTPFLQNRTALVLYPLLVLFVCFVLRFVLEHYGKPLFLKSLVVLASIFCSILFSKGFQLKYFYDWRSQAETREKLDAIVNDVQESGRVAENVGVFLYWSHGVFNNYYKFLSPEKYRFKEVPFWDSSSKKYLTIEEILKVADYAIIANSDLLRQKHLNYVIVKDFTVSQTKLIKLIR